ncbi:ESPR-type extended signal peptide-containing protein [Moraxella lacunata]|uniref:ESPR-type extended signal peptide-containing protein n=1 Tax=Moraxella lacunata TaxID=477 RepID=UPI000E0EE0DE|nr:ESPR-type extended signal peptide-containing protein [Moraxella lacunata]
MNHIYRVVFNHATGVWQSVSELARSKGKTKSIKSLVFAIGLVMGGQALAEPTMPPNTTPNISINDSTIKITQSGTLTEDTTYDAFDTQIINDATLGVKNATLTTTGGLNVGEIDHTGKLIADGAVINVARYGFGVGASMFNVNNGNLVHYGGYGEALFDNASSLIVGDNYSMSVSNGKLTLQGGSTATTNYLNSNGLTTVGYSSAITLKDPNTKVTANVIRIGGGNYDSATGLYHGNLNINNQATANTTYLQLGNFENGSGEITVSDAGSSINSTRLSHIADKGKGILTIKNGAKSTNEYIFLVLIVQAWELLTFKILEVNLFPTKQQSLEKKAQAS